MLSRVCVRSFRLHRGFSSLSSELPFEWRIGKSISQTDIDLAMSLAADIAPEIEQTKELSLQQLTALNAITRCCFGYEHWRHLGNDVLDETTEVDVHIAFSAPEIAKAYVRRLFECDKNDLVINESSGFDFVSSLKLDRKSKDELYIDNLRIYGVGMWYLSDFTPIYAMDSFIRDSDFSKVKQIFGLFRFRVMTIVPDKEPEGLSDLVRDDQGRIVLLTDWIYCFDHSEDGQRVVSYELSGAALLDMLDKEDEKRRESKRIVINPREMYSMDIDPDERLPVLMDLNEERIALLKENEKRPFLEKITYIP